MLYTFARISEKIDWGLFIPAVFLTLFGALTLVEPGNLSFFYKQILWLVIGSLMFVGLSVLDYRIFQQKKLIWFLMGASFLFLVLVLFFGETVKGAQSRFYFAGIGIQPSEFVKLVFILVLAKFFAKRHVNIAQKSVILTSILYVLFFVVPILLQPDFGIALIYLAIWAFVIFASGIPKKDLLVLASIGVVIFFVAWNFLFLDYQKQRILTFFDPLQDIYGSGYNVYQSLIAIGSGGLFGKGVAYGTQSKLSFLPEYKTDFMFAAFAEEWGFVGVVVVLALFGFLMYRILVYARYSAGNFEKLFAVGVFAMLFTQFVIHVGMNLGVMPVTGLPLPFVSYGGSHILVEFMALGILSAMKESFGHIKISSKHEFESLNP